jgi:hypothetical protein
MMGGFIIGSLVTLVISVIASAIIREDAEMRAYKQGYLDCENGRPMKRDWMEGEDDEMP